MKAIPMTTRRPAQFDSFAVVAAIVLQGCGLGVSSPVSEKGAAKAHTPAFDAPALATQLRETVLDPKVLGAPDDPPRYGSGVANSRVDRQIKAAQKFARPLLSSYPTALVPLRALVTDDEVDVRRAVVGMLDWRVGGWALGVDGGQELVSVNPRAFTEVVIPLLETALSDSDPNVRVLAAAGLGDSTQFSPEKTADRFVASLPKLLKLQNDADPVVRKAAYAATFVVVGVIEQHAADEETRKSATRQWEKYGAGKTW